MNPILARKSVAVTALVGLLGMTGYVIMQPFNGLDHSLQQAIGQLQRPFLTSVMKLVSTIGNPAIVLVVMAVLAVTFGANNNVLRVSGLSNRDWWRLFS